MADPGAAVLVVAAAGTYAVGWRRAVVDPDGTGRRRWQPWLFGAGLATVAVALVSPLDGRAHIRLAVHMVQHVLLLAVAPPLLVAASPGPTLLAGLPAAVRDVARHGWTLVRDELRSARWPAWTAAAVVVQTAVMWAWHAPGLYQATLHRPELHALEHLTFLGGGLLFWATMAAAVGTRRGSAVVALFVAALPGSALGAALTLAATPWYPAYPSLDDQQLAGVVMWAFAGTVYVVAAGVVFGLWLAAEESYADGTPPAAPVGVGS
ncbi:MAG: putative rane protein [Actinomycetota bacterium]|nr:putative rane protein [Actinomycetota bacterium]